MSARATRANWSSAPASTPSIPTPSAARFRSSRRRWRRSLELFPIFSRLKMLRSWAGIVDVSPDASPIIGKLPVEGLYLNGGWGTGGFKATPGAGHVFAHTIAQDEPHPLARAVCARPLRHRRARSTSTAPPPWRIEGAVMLLIPCPWCGAARRDRVSLRRRGAHRAAADPDALDDAAWADYLFMRNNPKGMFAERWVHQRRLPALVQPACATPSRTASSRSTRSAKRPAELAWRRPVTQPFRLPRGGRIDRGRRPALPLRRARI